MLLCLLPATKHSRGEWGIGWAAVGQLGSEEPLISLFHPDRGSLRVCTCRVPWAFWVPPYSGPSQVGGGLPSGFAGEAGGEDGGPSANYECGSGPRSSAPCAVGLNIPPSPACQTGRGLQSWGVSSGPTAVPKLRLGSSCGRGSPSPATQGEPDI